MTVESLREFVAFVLTYLQSNCDCAYLREKERKSERKRACVHYFKRPILIQMSHTGYRLNGEHVWKFHQKIATKQKLLNRESAILLCVGMTRTQGKREWVDVCLYKKVCVIYKERKRKARASLLKPAEETTFPGGTSLRSSRNECWRAPRTPPRSRRAPRPARGAPPRKGGPEMFEALLVARDGNLRRLG